MGKRKRRLHCPPIAPLSATDVIPCSSGMNLLSTEVCRSRVEKPPNHISTRTEQPHSSGEAIMGSREQQNEQITIFHHQHHHHHHHNNPSRSMHSKHSHNRGQHYPRHNRGQHHGKNNSSLDHNNRWTSELGYNTEGRERAFLNPERIRSSDTPMEIITGDDDKMVCGTCERLLRQKHPLGSGFLSSEPSVVAVLVCGHFFHVDCLEEATSAEDASDPQCPLC